MDPNTSPAPINLPTPSTNFAPPPPRKGGNLLLWMLVTILGLGAVGFGIVSVIAFGEASKAKTAVDAQKAEAAKAARAEQKKDDQRAAELAAESPFRSYVAPLEFGSFEIKFPKNWSAWVQQNASVQMQVELVVHPDFVRRENNADRLMATRVQLIKRQMNDFVKSYEGQKKLIRTDTTVSGIKGVQITGPFSDRRTTRMVIIPVRDKSLVFINEEASYAPEFDQILAQSKALP